MKEKVSKPIDIDATRFDDFVKKHDFAVVDFWSPTCPPCLMLAPVIKELASEHAGKVVFGKVNISAPKNAQIASRFGVQVIPTLLIFKNGELKDRMVGFRNKEQLEQELGL